jgi:ribosomal protein L11 methyltransferase
MVAMNWVEVCISTRRDGVQAIQDLLESFEAQAVTLLDDADEPVLEPRPGETPLWPTVNVCGLFDAAVDRASVDLALESSVSFGDISWREIQDQNWERAWMDRFAPMQFGHHLWIVPSEMEPPEDSAAIIIKLDPGLAFGTGTHPTTALCLRWIDSHEFMHQRVVDYGCGSGILGIAACLKGAREVICVDNDPQALEATMDNARRNGVCDRLRCLLPGAYEAESIAKGGADLVLANILAGPLIELSDLLTHSLQAGGQLVLSGLLESQRLDVNDCYRDEFGTMGATVEDGWLRLDGRRLTQV